MKETLLKRSSLIKLFTLIITLVFGVEFFLMYLLEYFLGEDATHLAESLTDAFILSLVLSPVLYFFAFRFLVKEIKSNEDLGTRYKYLFQFSQDAIMTLSPPDWKFTDGNPATLKIYGLKSEEELRSITPGDVSPEHQPDGQLSSVKAKAMIELAMEKGNNTFEWVHKKLNGPEFLANVTLTKIEIGGQTILQAVVRDITNEKSSSESIKKSVEETKKALDEAQRLNNLMVGRELEMLKLKKEISELKAGK